MLPEEVVYHELPCKTERFYDTNFANGNKMYAKNKREKEEQ